MMTLTKALYFYKCTVCFMIASAYEEISAAKCGCCDGRIEKMGKVLGNRLVDVSTQCACDGRCTNATGPNCDCQCLGANHGTGRLVTIVTDLGPVPILKPQQEVIDKHTNIAVEYKQLRAKAREVAEKLLNSGYVPDKGKWMDAKFGITKMLNKAGTMKNHTARSKYIQEYIDYIGG